MSLPQRDGLELEEHIRKYFLNGYSYRTILILKGKFNISLRQLKRFFRRMGLRRRARISLSYEACCMVVMCIMQLPKLDYPPLTLQREIEGSSILLGYRAFWRRKKKKSKIPVSRKTVMELLRFITPEETQRRRRNRLRRRTFHIRGPNEVDGYDKLKRYGFAIHGCIDACILWLKVSKTNNDPKVIAWYYLKCVEKFEGTLKLLCPDCGTENGELAFLHPFVCQAAETSFCYVRSVSNQRIEAFWSILRWWCSEWWIDFFHSMEYEGFYEECNFIHSDTLRFCFMHLIQKELDDVVTLWNASLSHTKGNTLPTLLGVEAHPSGSLSRHGHEQFF